MYGQRPQDFAHNSIVDKPKYLKVIPTIRIGKNSHTIIFIITVSMLTMSWNMDLKINNVVKGSYSYLKTPIRSIFCSLLKI